MKKLVQLSCMVIITFILLNTQNVSAAETYKEFDSKKNVDPSHEWKINFNDNVEKETVNDKNIYITDSHGKHINLEFTIPTDKPNAVQVKSSAPYDYGESYTLFVKNIKSSKEKLLHTAVKMSFTIKQNMGVYIPDQYLEAAIRNSIGKETGDISEYDMEDLIVLHFDFRNPADFTGLSYAKNLEVFSAEYSNNYPESAKISDISFLENFQQLGDVDIKNNEVEDISVLDKLPLLGFVDVSGNPLNDQAANIVKKLKNRGVHVVHDPFLKEEVDIPDIGLRDSVKIALNKKDNIITVGDMLRLENLVAVGKQIEDLTGLEYATNLKRLYLQHNEISDIRPIIQLFDLQELSLENNRIDFLSNIFLLEKMEKLYLHRNQISYIGSLSSMKNLQILNLQENVISDITPLQNLPYLSEVVLNSNKIKDIAALEELGRQSLKKVWIVDNPLSSSSATTINSLLSKQVYVSYEPLNITSSPPPFSSTNVFGYNLLTEKDPSSFTGLNYTGQEKRKMFDRRINDWIETRAYLFKAQFSDGHEIEIQVNPEFENIQNAQLQAMKYAKQIGQLPAVLRAGVYTVWIHKGDRSPGGGNNNILIHTDRAEQYMTFGAMEEVLFQSAGISTLNPRYARNAYWREAQLADGRFISEVAQTTPYVGDVTESFTAYYFMKYYPERLSPEIIKTIQQTIPNRLNFFERQGL
ncbi:MULTISPECIES: leucine-rich repeat domain-containing protein [unclassified Sporosarcina]|uniref:leucine-rich repeat domain-containing protein n=1 Tax=unclassified Sporosarcina TaxID=2647733 RepID=UPI00203F0173|nr:MULTISPECIES: leucine-rich repeat domain-containing protein [unclassified Sporosarcina]GKV66217.1 hypothetical protein NCCP2331_23700 [Sporosarcina sp. NCCP-2331]GLB56253.1 hypothetical protein NCCP2378_20400 [Sporosarcina sp. NCCP-2378]